MGQLQDGVPAEMKSHYKVVPGASVEGLMLQYSAVLTHDMSKQRFQAVRKAGYHFSVFVLTGSKDILIHPLNSKILNSMMDGRLVVVPGAGHGLMFQCEKEVRGAIVNNIMRGEALRKVEGIA